MQIIFVYGTLRSGHRNHYLLAGSEFLGRGKTDANYTLINNGSYPILIPSGSSSIHGELYRVSESVMERLDELEDCPGYFERIQIDVDGLLAWVYCQKKIVIDQINIIASGDWNTAKPSTTIL